MTHCIQCSAALTPNGASSHWRRFHALSSPTLFTCPDCGCDGGELGDALVHCLLHGHGFGSFLTRARENGLPQFLFAAERNLETLDENDADLPDLTTAQSRRKRTRTTSRNSQLNVPQQPMETFISKPQSNDETHDFTGDRTKTALSAYSIFDAPSSQTPQKFSPAISPFKSMNIADIPEDQSRTVTTSPPVIPDTTEQLYSEICQQCFKPISLHPKRGAIDHVCACRQVTSISDTLPLNQRMTEQVESANCQLCSSSISVAHNRGAVDHVCGCRQVTDDFESFENRDSDEKDEMLLLKRLLPLKQHAVLARQCYHWTIE